MSSQASERPTEIFGLQFAPFSRSVTLTSSRSNIFTLLNSKYDKVTLPIALDKLAILLIGRSLSHIPRYNTEIEWLDARSIDGWCEERDFEEALSLIKTSGYLIKENDDALFISAAAALSHDSGNSYACTIVVPKKMITHQKIIKE